MSRVGSVAVGIALAALLAATSLAVVVARAPAANASSTGTAIVAAARGQAGYKANPYGSSCNKFSASWGSGSDCGNGNRSVAWCADFVAWAWAQAGIVGLYGHGINANASSFRTWGQANGRWHPSGDGYTPQPGDAAQYGDAHVGIYTGGSAGSPTVINGNWWSPDRGTGQVTEQSNESSNGAGAALSGYVSAPAGKTSPPPPPAAAPNAVAGETNADGRIEFFGVNTHRPNGQNDIYHQWQATPGGSWSGLYSLSGYLTSIAVARNKDGRLEAFGVNAHQPDGQNNTYHAWQTSPGGSWSGWYSMSGYLTGIAAETNADGRIELMGVDAHRPDGQNDIYHQWQGTPGGSWSGWYSMSGYLTTVGVARNNDGRLEVFGANAHQPDGQNNIHHAWQTSPGGSWSGWDSMSGYLTGIAAETNADGRIELIGVDANRPDGQNDIYHKWQGTPGGSWSGWYSMSGYLTTVGVARNNDGRLEVFGANAHKPDGQNNIYHAWQTTPGGTWSAWYAFAGYLG